MAFGKVYCFGPTFRAEKSKTRRHLIEFWMLEPEMAFATLDDVMALEEKLMLEHVVGRVLDERAEELKVLERDSRRRSQRVRTPFPADALRRGGRDAASEAACPFEWGGDFGAPDETALAEDVRPAGVRAPLSRRR